MRHENELDSGSASQQARLDITARLRTNPNIMLSDTQTPEAEETYYGVQGRK